MKLRGMWLGAAVGSVVGLAGCSGKIDPKKDCVREFVQEFVLDAWGWQPGLRPAPDAPVWRMDAFRDRFLSAFGP